MKTTKQKIVLPRGWRKLRKGEIIRATDVELANITDTMRHPLTLGQWVYWLERYPFLAGNENKGKKVKCATLSNYSNHFYRFTPQRTDNSVPGTEAQQ